jgi:hypothetical protein
MKKTALSFFIALVGIIISAESILAQSCPMCKESVSNSGQRLSEGFYNSILALVFLPASLVGGLSIYVIRAKYRKEHPDSDLSTIGMIREYLRERKNRDSQ